MTYETPPSHVTLKFAAADSNSHIARGPLSAIKRQPDTKGMFAHQSHNLAYDRG